MGRGGAAEPVHGELLLGMGGAAPHDAPRRHRRAAAARAVRQDDRGEEFPQRAGDAAPDRVRGVRHAAAFGFRSGVGANPARPPAGSARARRGAAPACVQPLSEQLLAHLRRRLRCRVLQLQVGGGAFGRRVQLRRGKRRARRSIWPEIPRRDPRRRRQSAGRGVVPRFPRPRAARRSAAQAQWYDFRMILKRIGVVLALALAAGAAAAQQLYRWTDEKGRLHVADTPPPPGAKDVHRWRVAASSPTEDGSEPYALRQARKESPVTLYTASDCEPCNDARKLLNVRGIPFKEVSVTEKEVNDLVKLAGSASVPVIVVGSATQKGFEESVYERLLDDAGYPKTGILPRRSQAEPKPGAEVKPAPEEEVPRGPYAPGAPPQRLQRK